MSGIEVQPPKMVINVDRKKENFLARIHVGPQDGKLVWLKFEGVGSNRESAKQHLVQELHKAQFPHPVMHLPEFDHRHYVPQEDEEHHWGAGWDDDDE